MQMLFDSVNLTFDLEQAALGAAQIDYKEGRPNIFRSWSSASVALEHLHYELYQMHQNELRKYFILGYNQEYERLTKENALNNDS